MQQIQPVQKLRHPAGNSASMHTHQDLPPSPVNDKTMIYISLAAVMMATLGSLTGWGIYRTTSADSGDNQKNAAVLGEGKNENVDESMFADAPDAEGTLIKGGVDGEGTHKLERGVGADKDIYLLSTVLDLESFEGKKVQIWGNTISAKDAPWLMDVGRVKVLK